MSANTFLIVVLIIVLAIISTRKLSAQESPDPTRPPNSEPSAADKESIIVNTRLISFNVSITNPGGMAVTGLTKQDFSIFDNKIPQEIQFFSDEDAPASISLIIDTSGSMRGKKIEQAKRALAGFIQTSKEQDEFFLIDVGSEATLLLNGTRNSEAILEKFNFIRPKGQTALYDAINLGIEQVGRGTYSRKIVLLISDGEDNNSRLNFKKLKTSLKESSAIIYAVGVGGYLPSVTRGLSGRDALEELASVSGGKAFFPDNADQMNEAFDKIALDIRHLYSIGYYPSEPAPKGKNHRITIKVKAPPDSTRLIVRGRKEYIFSESSSVP